MSMLQLYAVFHLNLAYSSIEETRRADVIKSCYWPLLHLARRYRLPFGIEATGYTLETISDIDSVWISELQSLIEDDICELIGSGYTQLIGPLVPARINTENQRLGIAVYQRLLGKRPELALVNEQAWSAGLVRHYLDAGYRAVIMEWDNAATTHPEWHSEWRYLPHYALGTHDERIPLIWNQSIVFQKFQRYAHGEIELDEYLHYLNRYIGEAPRTLSLYGNDAEIFNFRPGRYHTEAKLGEENEWNRLERLFTALASNPEIEFIRPSDVLDQLDMLGAGQSLALSSAQQPIVVKKQDKYNVSRWAATGRADLDINTRCRRLYEDLQRDASAEDADWRELCELWSSDFRTHITETRWQTFQQRLDAALIRRDLLQKKPKSISLNPRKEKINSLGSVCRVHEEGYLLNIESDLLHLRLNLRRGLAIEALTFRNVSNQSLLGTLPHGYFDDIRWGADFYSGHLILERPGYPKITDLEWVRPHWQFINDGLDIYAEVSTPLGLVEKRIRLDFFDGQVRLEYQPHWKGIPKGSFRLGFITLNPSAFTAEHLYLATHNGGGEERFPLFGQVVEHGRPVSFLVSASQALGLTEGWAELGDAHQALRIELDCSEAASIGLLTHQRIGNSYFCRLTFSAGEIDDTCRDGLWPVLRYAFTLSARCM